MTFRPYGKNIQNAAASDQATGGAEGAAEQRQGRENHP
jgi:hypothetical protein